MYLLTGALAILCGVAVVLWMPDSPLHATFLSREERIIAIERVRNDQGGTENKTIKRYQLVEAVTDIRTWLIVLLTLMSASVHCFSLPRSTLTAFVASIPNGSLSNCEIPHGIGKSMIAHHVSYSR